MMDLLLTHGYFLHEDAKELQIMKPYAPLGILVNGVMPAVIMSDMIMTRYATKEEMISHYVPMMPVRRMFSKSSSGVFFITPRFVAIIKYFFFSPFAE